MPKLDATKLSALKNLLKKNNLDGIVISDYTDMKYVLGEIFLPGEAVLLAHKKGIYVTSRSLYAATVKAAYPQIKIEACDSHRELKITETAKKLGLKKIAFDKTLDMLKYKRPIILFLVDGIEGISHRDMTLIQEINNLALPMILCINKIDLLDAKQQKHPMAKTKAVFDFAKYIPIFGIPQRLKKESKKYSHDCQTSKRRPKRELIPAN
jgi:hypothetical protein